MNTDVRFFQFIRFLGLSLLGLLGIAALGGCESGDGNIGVGSGQEPDPVAVDFPIAYTKGPLFDAQLQLQAGTDVRELDRFIIGTDLYVRDRASPTAPERNITLDVTQGQGDVMGLDISADGRRIVFAMRGPFDPNLPADEQPTWNIWEYDISADTLRRIIPSDILAEAGQDISPHYLPDGRIVFSSTRQRTSKAILLDEGKPQFAALDENRNEPASVLHVMNDDGSDIHQISFNQSHDYAPTVLASGQVMFSRWDHAVDANGIALYRMNPDGTALELLYGAESHQTGTNGSVVQFTNPREMMDGRIMAIIRPFVQTELGGQIVTIDTDTYVENTQPIAVNMGLSGPAQTEALGIEVRTDALPSPGGRFGSAFPLWDGTGRVFVTWSNCRVVIDAAITACTPENTADPNVELAPPLYGVWMYDPRDETQLPIVVGEEGVLISEVVAAQPRSAPVVLVDQAAGLDPDLVAENAGILNIRSVYDIDGVDVATPSAAALADPAVALAADRPARFVRVIKAVGIPDADIVDLNNSAFGPRIRLGMREIVAYAPVEPDGSVRMKVPANVPLAVSVLDAAGHRISPRHENWLQVSPGEELRCNGCHAPQSGLSHGRRDSFATAYPGAQASGVPFTNTVSSVLPFAGETMAEARTRVSCATDCAALAASLDLVYDDVWTDPAVRAPDAPFAYTYAGLATPMPTTIACRDSWSSDCRSVINYEQHVHPLWGLQRLVIDPNDGVTVLEDHTCASGGCHAPFDAFGLPAVPAAQLDLSDGLSPEQQDQFNSYRELLFSDNEQELVTGALQDRQVINGTDANGNPIFASVSIDPPMSADGANASDRFFTVFEPGQSHAGYLSDHELRLVAEWLDIGAQYYNNPFDVPVN